MAQTDKQDQPVDELCLNGTNIAILVTNGFEQVELTGPREAFEKAGALTKIISASQGKVQGFHHDVRGDQFDVNLSFDQADPQDFDALLLPGGVINSDAIRMIPEAQRFVQGMQRDGKPIAVICHGGWLLVSAGLVKGRTMTSWPTLHDDIANAGGNWVDREVVQDGNLISSRKPADIPAFSKKAIEVLAQRIKASVRGTENEQIGVGASS
jgi:protease I